MNQNHLILRLLTIALSLSVSSLPADEAANYCHDPQTDADWERMITSHEGDRDFTYLYSLRKDLCTRVDEGEISLGDAIERFEEERHRVIQERMRRIQQREGGSGRVGVGLVPSWLCGSLWGRFSAPFPQTLCQVVS
jgi:hypothetical protein